MKNGITHDNLGKRVEEYSLDDIQRINEVYVCFDFMCNLNCPHCTLKDIPQYHDYDSILKSLEYLDSLNKDFTINLFGGEPFINKDENLKKFEHILKKHPLVISTNLLNISEYKIHLMKLAEDVNTSWNPLRFTKEQYNKWLSNIKLLEDNNIRYSVMITLTKDLIDYDVNDFYNLVKSWSKCRNIDLKQMIGDDDVDFDKVDEWLCKLYDIWGESPNNLLFEEIERIIKKEKIWKNYCETYFTLMPNGLLKDGCPYFEYKTDKSKCLACEYYPICEGGCNIQERCSFPKKLYEKIKNEKIIYNT